MIPKFKCFHKPFLKALASGKALGKPAIMEAVCKELNITNEDKAAKTTSGVNVVYDRISWCCRASVFSLNDIMRYMYYTQPFLGKYMKAVNFNVYDLIDFFGN